MSFLRGKPDPTAVADTAAPAPAPAAGNLSNNWFQQTMGDDMPAAAAPSGSPGFDANEATDGAPRKRHSILETVGKIADVFAAFGGQPGGYQTTLDGRVDRANELAHTAQQSQMDTLKLQGEQGSLADSATKRITQAATGAKAILAANPNADLSQIWPLVAQQTGVDPAHAAQIAKAVSENPSILDGLAAVGTKATPNEFGLQPFYAKDKAGNVTTYQLGKDGSVHAVALPDGVAAIDPAKATDLGGSVAMVGTRSGNVTRILPKTEAPGKALDRASRENIARGNNATTLKVQALPQRAKAAGAAGSGEGQMGTASMLLDNIEKGFNDLHGLNALPGDTKAGPLNNILQAAGRTSIGQAIGEQAGSAPAQKRLSIEKDINSLQSEMVKSLPASATRTKFEQEIQRRRLPDPSRMSYATSQAVIADLRRTFVQAQQDAAKEIAAKPGAGPKRITPAAPAAAAGGWKVIGVK